MLIPKKAVNHFKGLTAFYFRKLASTSYYYKSLYYLFQYCLTLITNSVNILLIGKCGGTMNEILNTFEMIKNIILCNRK